MPCIDSDTLVVYAPIKDMELTLPLYPTHRQEEIFRCKNEAARQQKYFVWKLLERAIDTYTSLRFANLKFTKTPNGKWVCPDICFSLSHTDGLVCVALSQKSVGVDVERMHNVKSALKEKILTERELLILSEMSDEKRGEYLLESWVRKESIFKKGGGEALLPNRIESSEHHTVIEHVSVGDEKFIISVACNSDQKVKYIYMEDI